MAIPTQPCTSAGSHCMRPAIRVRPGTSARFERDGLGANASQPRSRAHVCALTDRSRNRKAESTRCHASTPCGLLGRSRGDPPRARASAGRGRDATRRAGDERCGIVSITLTSLSRPMGRPRREMAAACQPRLRMLAGPKSHSSSWRRRRRDPSAASKVVLERLSPSPRRYDRAARPRARERRGPRAERGLERRR